MADQRIDTGRKQGFLLTVNGTRREVRAFPDTPLLWILGGVLAAYDPMYGEPQTDDE